MSKKTIKGLVIILFLLIFSNPGQILAQTTESWTSRLISQIDQNPEIVVARKNLEHLRLTAAGRQQPLYNPEFETEYERNGDDNNYRIGLSQTLDIWGKRGIRTQQSQAELTAAETEFKLKTLEKTAEILKLLAEWQAAGKAAALSLQQKDAMTALAEQVKQRQMAGDAGLIDSELAFLNLSENLKNTVAARIRVRRTEARLKEELPEWSVAAAPIPEEFWSAAANYDLQKLIDNHPRVALARLNWEARKHTAELTRQQAKPDPTIGFNAGEDGEENVFALTFSIPLNILNSFSAETDAANQDIVVTQARYQALKRRQLIAAEAAAETMKEYQQSYKQWQEIMRLRGEQSRQLLEKHWQSGDLDTTGYLRIRQQQNENLRTGIELEALYHTALIDLYLQSGHLSTIFNQL